MFLMIKSYSVFEINFLFADMKASLMFLVLCCILLTVNADDWDDLFGTTEKPKKDPYETVLDFEFESYDLPCPSGQKRNSDGKCQHVIHFR